MCTQDKTFVTVIGDVTGGGTRLLVRRKSGTTDIVLLKPWILPGKGKEYPDGTRIQVEGVLVSYFEKDPLGNNRSFVAINPIGWEETSKPHKNEVVLIGTICKKSMFRKTPYGRSISDVMLAVNPMDVLNPGIKWRSVYIPLIFWGLNARDISEKDIGTRIKVYGRLQSREYDKDGYIHTVQELSVSMFEELPIL